MELDHSRKIFGCDRKAVEDERVSLKEVQF
jgi:hypothetical protein